MHLTPERLGVRTHCFNSGALILKSFLYCPMLAVQQCLTSSPTDCRMEKTQCPLLYSSGIGTSLRYCSFHRTHHCQIQPHEQGHLGIY